jgi:hypothetical protein
MTFGRTAGMDDALWLTALSVWVGVASYLILSAVSWIWVAGRCAVFTLKVRRAWGFSKSTTFWERLKANRTLFKVFWRNAEHSVRVEGQIISWPKGRL